MNALSRNPDFGSCPASHTEADATLTKGRESNRRVFSCPVCEQLISTYSRDDGPWLILGHEDRRGPTLSMNEWIAD